MKHFSILLWSVIVAFAISFTLDGYDSKRANIAISIAIITLSIEAIEYVLRTIKAATERMRLRQVCPRCGREMLKLGDTRQSFYWCDKCKQSY